MRNNPPVCLRVSNHQHTESKATHMVRKHEVCQLVREMQSYAYTVPKTIYYNCHHVLTSWCSKLS